MAKAKIKALPRKRKVAKPRKGARKKGISLTQLAIKQVELMLVAVYREKNKRLPSQQTLHRMAERFHKKHFE